jgi:PAS domain S-box-containing protein
VSANLEPELPLGVIRIVVVAAPREKGESPPPMDVETTAALARLGDPVELLRAETPEELARLLDDPAIDLVLLDRLDMGDTTAMLAAIGDRSTPSVVVCGDSEEEALAAFRAGASDCIQYGADYDRVLPVVLLEQVRGGRATRQRLVSEHRIRRLENLNAAIVSEMPAGLAVIDPDGLIVAENPEFTRLFPPAGGVPLATGGREPVPEFLAARVPAAIVDAVERRELSGDTPGVEGAEAELVRVEGDEGAVRAYEVRRRRLEEGDRSLLLVSDVTTSEWLSDRLETLQRDTRDIIENINSALLVVDLGGHITFANRAAEQILGGQDGDLGGRQVGDWFGAEGEASSPIEECLLNGRRSRGTETLLQRADGQWIPVGVSCSPRLDRDGRSRGAVAIFQDLSEIKELELQVRQTEKMASVGQLAAGVAHEVNNPMGFIHANLNQMAEYLGDFNRYFEATTRLVGAALEGDGELVRAAAEDVDAVSREIDFEYVRQDFEKALLESSEGAERIRHIVKDLRDFSRPDLPERVPADLNQALDSTANIVFTMMKHSVELEKDYGEIPKIEAYPMQLKQVFMNLLVNAYQAIEARDVSEPGVIRLETRRENDEIVIRIADTGVGIEASHLARIFEPFFTTKPVGAGTGLGLSTSYKIVERHGGRILVDSEIDRGTTFEVWLPLQPEPASEGA